MDTFICICISRIVIFFWSVLNQYPGCDAVVKGDMKLVLIQRAS